jgi:two-component sensor histidine kinase/PAS domain-containing protein
VDAKVHDASSLLGRGAQETASDRADADLLSNIRRALPILSDLSRSDLLVYAPSGAEEVLITDQARPHSIFPLYEEDLVGRRVDVHVAPWVFRALASARLHRGVQGGTVRDVPIVREVLPIVGSQGRTIAALSIETNLLAHERHRRRSRVFQRALRQLQAMVLRGQLANAERLSPFGEHDGIVVVDPQRRIQYMSGIATNLYRRIGHMGNLLHRSVYAIETGDAELVEEALNNGTCLEREGEEHGRIWMRKVIPLYAPREHWVLPLRRVPDLPCPAGCLPVGAIWTVHDATEARDKEQELKAKMAMVQEIHHRVKNNLQAIASLLRLQSRRASSSEVQQALVDTVNRILSVAVVHEFLSYDSASVINLREVAQRIMDQMAQSVIDPDKRIEFRLDGPGIYLSSQQATACALIINELLLNAVEHGYEQREVGMVKIDLADDGEWVTIQVGDDGAGLRGDFDVDEHGGLGLRIVRTLVQGDLKGRFELHGEAGVRAVVAFPRTSLGGNKN